MTDKQNSRTVTISWDSFSASDIEHELSSAAIDESPANATIPAVTSRNNHELFSARDDDVVVLIGDEGGPLRDINLTDDVVIPGARDVSVHHALTFRLEQSASVSNPPELSPEPNELINAMPNVDALNSSASNYGNSSTSTSSSRSSSSLRSTDDGSMIQDDIADQWPGDEMLVEENSDMFYCSGYDTLPSDHESYMSHSEYTISFSSGLGSERSLNSSASAGSYDVRAHEDAFDERLSDSYGLMEDSSSQPQYYEQVNVDRINNQGEHENYQVQRVNGQVLNETYSMSRDGSGSSIEEIDPPQLANGRGMLNETYTISNDSSHDNMNSSNETANYLNGTNDGFANYVENVHVGRLHGRILNQTYTRWSNESPGTQSPPSTENNTCLNNRVYNIHDDDHENRQVERLHGRVLNQTYTISSKDSSSSIKRDSTHATHSNVLKYDVNDYHHNQSQQQNDSSEISLFDDNSPFRQPLSHSSPIQHRNHNVLANNIENTLRNARADLIKYMDHALQRAGGAPSEEYLSLAKDIRRILRNGIRDLLRTLNSHLERKTSRSPDT